MFRKLIANLFPYFLILLGAVARVLPHPPNFAPIAALALFGSVYIGGKKGLLIPLGAMLVSDWFIGFYNLWIMASVYGSFILVGFLGKIMAREVKEGKGVKEVKGVKWVKEVKAGRRWIAIGGCSFLGSILFYFITNWAVWAFGSMYPHTIVGLFESYVMGLPFFRNTLAGDIFYVTIFFAAAEYMKLSWVYGIKKRLILSQLERA